MHIVELGSFSPRAMARFSAVTAAVYAADPVWAPASEAVVARQWAHHGGLFRAFVAERGGPLARAVAILPEGATEGYIGHFECLPDHPEAAAQVLARCEAALRAAGATRVQAPKADNQLFGCQTDGFDLPHLCLTPHNPPYYAALFGAAGYTAKHRLLAYSFTRDVARLIALTPASVRTRPFDPAQLDREIGIFHALQIAIFGARPGYVPRSLDEDRALVTGLLPMLDPDLVVIAEDGDGQPIGLLVCLPDCHQAMTGQPVDRARVMSIGVHPDHAGRGVGTAMAAHLMRVLLRNERFTFVEASLILGDNTGPQRLAARFHAQPGRTFALFEKPL